MKTSFLRSLWGMLLFSFLVFAQSFPVQNGALASDSKRIDSAAINRSADALEALGAEVLVLFVEADTGRTLSDAEAYFDKALERFNLRRDGVYKNNLFAIFIGTDPLERDDNQRPLYIVYGEDLNPLFARDFGSKNLDEVLRETVMIPKLQKGDFTGAITDALAEAARQLALSNTLAQNPNAQVNVPLPSATQPVAGPNLFSQWWPLLLLVFVGFLLFRRRKKKTVATTVPTKILDPEQNLADKKSLEVLLKDLSEDAISTGHDPYLPEDPSQQTDMKLLRKLLKDERPQELADLENQYRESVAKLKDLKGTLAASSKRTDFGALLTEASSLKQFTHSLTERWDDLQLELSNFEDKRQAVEQHLQSSFKAYESMRQADWPVAQKVFEVLIRFLADSDAAKHKQKPLTALTMLDELNARLEQLNRQLPRLQGIGKKLLLFEANVAGFQEQGYKLNAGKANLDSAREQFRVALDLLKQGDFKVLDAQIDEANELVDSLESYAKELLALKETNASRLAELERKGDEIRSLIDQAVPQFESIQSYAEVNWRDIKGNGTEAQKAANRAHELFEHAQSQHESQHFEEAKDSIDLAFVELEQAHELIDAIFLRLENLKKAETTSRQELKLIEAEVSKHLDWVKQAAVDRNVSEKPEEDLQQAYQLLQQTKTELAQSEPNWLAILERVQKADKLSTEAFIQIRTEHEAMERRQTLMQSEKTEARVALERVLKFAHLHPQDMSTTAMQLLDEAQTYYAQAEGQEKHSQTLEEVQLAKVLEQATQLFDLAQKKAEAAFSEAEGGFKTMEALRQKTVQVVAEADSALRSLKLYASRAQLDRSLQQSLYQLEKNLPGYDARATKQELEQTIRDAESIKLAVNQLQHELASRLQQADDAARQERQRQLELERQQRAAEAARQGSAWGSWPNSLPPIIISPPRQSQVSRHNPRNLPAPGSVRLPTARSAPPVRLPARPPAVPSRPSQPGSGGRMAGGGWGGSGRKTGGGW